MAIALPEDFSEFLRLLNRSEVRYLIVGGYAVSFHGYPRATQDIDIWIDPHPDNVAKAARVIADFGFAGPALEQWQIDPVKMLRMGYPPDRIEVLVSISGVSFDEAYDRRMHVDLGGVSVNMIGLHDLRMNKRASGRHKDLDDLENLPHET